MIAHVKPTIEIIALNFLIRLLKKLSNPVIKNRKTFELKLFVRKTL